MWGVHSSTVVQEMGVAKTLKMDTHQARVVEQLRPNATPVMKAEAETQGNLC